MSLESETSGTGNARRPFVPDPRFVTEGTILDGRYRLDELIGSGGTSDVYRATDELLRRSVAVKVFDSRLTDLNTVVRQRNEMQMLARLAHPNLIAVFDARIAGKVDGGDDRHEHNQFDESTSGRTYLVLELVTGHTLADRLSSGPLPADQVAVLGWTLATVLQTVHDHDLVHRDVKPANILLSDSGQIKLGDFGLARRLSGTGRLTTSAEVMGTAAYFSPEQAQASEVGPAGDVYALGLVLLECLTGRREFPGDAVQAAVARLLRDPNVPADLPSPWPELLTGMTSRGPGDRPTARQVAAVLSASIDVGGVNSVVQASMWDIQASRWDADPQSATGGDPTAAWSSPLTPFLSSGATRMATRPAGRRRIAVAGASLVAVAAGIAVWAMVIPETDAPAATPGLSSTVTPASTPGSTSRGTPLPATTVRGTVGAAKSSRSAATTGVAVPARSSGRPTTRSVLATTHSATPVKASPPPPNPPATAAAVVTTAQVAATTAPAPVAKSAGKGRGNGNGKSKPPKRGKG